MRNLIVCLFCALACSRVAYPITATKAYVDGATNATLTAAKAYTDAHGGGAGGSVVLHYTRSTQTFIETPEEIARFATTNQPLFCAVDTNIWFKLDNVVRQSTSGVTIYNLTLTCQNASNSASGIYSPWIMSILCAPALNYVVAQIGAASMLADNYTMLTNSASFRHAVNALFPSVTNLYGFSRKNLIDGDRNVYVKLPFSAWTNDVAGGGGSIPAGLKFTPTVNYDTRYYIFAWEAKSGNDTYLLQKMSQPGGVFYYDLKKNRETPFPQASVRASESATVLDFRTFKLYKFGSGETIVKTDSLALGSFASNIQTQVSAVDTKVDNRTNRDYLATTIGSGSASRAGLLGLYSSQNGETLWPFSKNYWDLIVYPEVKSWAQGEMSKSGMPNHGLVLTNGTVKTKSGTSVTPANIGAATSNEVENVKTIVYTWESFLDGSNVVFSITNYISGSYNLNTAKLRILEMTNGVYREVYNSRGEIVMHLDDFRTNEFCVATNAVITSVDAKIAEKAEKAWGQYTSSGGVAPSNTVYMTAPSTVFAGGMEYERVAVGEGAVCILTTKGAPTYTTGDEGTFKFQDDGGTNYFGFTKTDSYTIGCHTDGISVSSGIVTLEYNVTMSGVPCVWYCPSIDSRPIVWEKLNLPDGSSVPGASHVVTWEQSPTAGKEICYLNCGSEPSGFFKATIEVAGYAKFMTNMPADLSGGILCTDGQHKVKVDYNGGNPRLVEVQ